MRQIGNIAFCILLIGGFSCSENIDQSEIETLQKSIDFIQKDNVILLSRIKKTLDESGRRTLDVKQYDLLERILESKRQVSLQWSDTLDVKNIDLYVEHLIGESEEYPWFSNIYPQELVQLMIMNRARFLANKNQRTYALLLLSIFSLQSEFIDDTGAMFGSNWFDSGSAYFYNTSDTLRKNIEFRSVITLSEPLDESLLMLGKENVRLSTNGQSISDYQLEYVGKGGWIFSFTPKTSGVYDFEFTVVANSLLYDDSFGFGFTLKKQFYVE